MLEFIIGTASRIHVIAYYFPAIKLSFDNHGKMMMVSVSVNDTEIHLLWNVSKQNYDKTFVTT